VNELMGGKIVMVSELADAAGKEAFRWLSDQADCGLEWHIFSSRQHTLLGRVRRPNLARYLACARAVLRAKRIGADLIVTHGTHTAVFTGFLRRLTQTRTPHLAWAFTLPEWHRMGDRTRTLVRSGCRNVDRFISFCLMEKENYPRYLDLPPERFQMLYWSASSPPLDRSRAPIVAGQYIASMGSQGRDYATLVEAVRPMTDLHLVIIGMPENLKGLNLPDNVSVYCDIPYADCLNIAHYADFMVLPLSAPDVPTGHGSLITQFLLHKPTIVTRSAAMRDYVRDGQNAIQYDAADPISLRQAIQTLRGDAQLAQQIAANAMAFAERQCNEASTIKFFHDYLRLMDIIPGQPNTPLI
jgi:glycosyltransferase involved in cell wall biosynthesis